MLAEFHPMPWSNFIFECYIYVLFMGVVHVAFFFFIGCPALSLISAFSKRQRQALASRIGRFAIFNLLLLLVGAVFSGVWSCTIWGRFYDSTDYTFDFIPFWPITQSTVDRPWGDERGRLFGISLFELQLIWLAFALGTWATTIYLYRTLERIRAADTPALIPQTTGN
jgi:hypothetical protein